MPISSQFEATIRAHLADEPDGNDRRILWSWLSSGNVAELERAFAEPIAFGTAGLRAVVGPGPARMNRRNVMRAARALTEVLDERVPDARTRGIVVGFDARPTSSTFAAAVRSVCTAAGFVVHAFDEPIPTPIVAFAAAEIRAAAAVVITASHNPPGDNGMKVYGPDASLIIAPWDREIAERMHDDRPSPEVTGGDDALTLTRTLDGEVARRHRARCLAIGVPGRGGDESGAERAPVRVAYTALHGVGEVHVRAALAELGHVTVASVADQALPDGTFPTTRSPNPEEPAALDRVMALATQTNATLILATDPDADRLAVGVRHAGELVMLHGDELGVLFGEYLLRRHHGPRPFAVGSIVSSPWLGQIAEALHARFEVTLTGHKWIHARALELVRDGASFVFGYEEALGYAFDNGVHDKDGIAAAVLAARIAGEDGHEGRTLIDRLERIAHDYGFHRSRSFSLRLDSPGAATKAAAVVDGLRQTPPESLGGRSWTRLIDGQRRTIRDVARPESTFALPASPLVAIELGTDLRVIVRPSGTEPKLKLYVDLASSLTPGESYRAGQARCDRELDSITTELRGWFESLA
jgi:phosphomannomutase